mmetsp:Transcript_107494/g.342698  ORF Transcript_107494/g.342698 Transcript_107494/m.342698 type:complete len:100 (-) Transcript_107494:335-634(-)
MMFSLTALICSGGLAGLGHRLLSYIHEREKHCMRLEAEVALLKEVNERMRLEAEVALLKEVNDQLFAEKKQFVRLVRGDPDTLRRRAWLTKQQDAEFGC